LEEGLGYLDTNERKELLRGLNYLKLDGVFSQTLGILISSTFITPLILIIGGTSFHVGLLFTLASLASFSQLLALNIMNKFHGRKRVSVVFSTIARTNLLILALIIISKTMIDVSLILIGFALFYIIMNISNCAFNYWMLEFVPDKIRGRYFASRMRLSLLIGGIIGLCATMYLESIGKNSVTSYGYIILLGSIIGLIGVYFLAHIPEPKFKGSEPLSGTILAHLLKEKNLRRHFEAIFLLSLAMNLSLPFFVYYMLTALKFNLITIFCMNMISQLCTILFLPKWGYLIDKYGVKPVLRFSASLIFTALLLWPFTTLPDPHIFSLFLVLIIHIIIGTTMGGLNLSSNLIAFKLARGKRATYALSLNNISISLGASTGSFLGALMSIPFRYMELSLTFSFHLSQPIVIFIVDLRGLDFIFVLSFLLGTISLSLLRGYTIEGELDEEKKYVEMMTSIKRYIYGLKTQIMLGIPRRVHASVYKRIYAIKNQEYRKHVTKCRVARAITRKS